MRELERLQMAQQMGDDSHATHYMKNTFHVLRNWSIIVEGFVVGFFSRPCRHALVLTAKI